MITAVQVSLIILAYIFLGGVVARLLWPVQKVIDRRAMKRDPTILKSKWGDYLSTACLFWPLLLVTYLCIAIAVAVKAIFSIGLSPEEKYEV